MKSGREKQLRQWTPIELRRTTLFRTSLDENDAGTTDEPNAAVAVDDAGSGEEEGDDDPFVATEQRALETVWSTFRTRGPAPTRSGIAFRS